MSTGTRSYTPLREAEPLGASDLRRRDTRRRGVLQTPVVEVSTPADLVIALNGGEADIMVTNHMDLTGLGLQCAPMMLGSDLFHAAHTATLLADYY